MERLAFLWPTGRHVLEQGVLHDTQSVYATTRPCNEPIIFKAGIVETGYKVLLQDGTQNIMQTTDVGYGSGYGLAPG